MMIVLLSTMPVEWQRSNANKHFVPEGFADEFI
jgi:hypothetical protein